MPVSDFDELMRALIDYAYETTEFGAETSHTAKLCLMDAIGCAVAASIDNDCSRLVGTRRFSAADTGIPLIGSAIKLGPIEAAFHIGSQISWLEFNDTWLGQEWGHPSDNLGAIFTAAIWHNIRGTVPRGAPLTLHDILPNIIRTYEIHGVLCLSNCFNEFGIDHVVLVKIASTLAASRLLGLSKEQALNALSNAVVDDHSLRTYRHASNASPRKSWEVGDATARGLQLALLAQANALACPTAWSESKRGFSEAILRGVDLDIARQHNDFVVRNILFKLSNPAEYHAQATSLRQECIPALLKKFVQNLAETELSSQAEYFAHSILNGQELYKLPVQAFLGMFASGYPKQQ